MSVSELQYESPEEEKKGTDRRVNLVHTETRVEIRQGSNGRHDLTLSSSVASPVDMTCTYP